MCIRDTRPPRDSASYAGEVALFIADFEGTFPSFYNIICLFIYFFLRFLYLLLILSLFHCRFSC